MHAVLAGDLDVGATCERRVAPALGRTRSSW
jgi:hypothetical protein